MKRFLFMVLVLITVCSYASQSCDLFADGVMANTKDKNVKTITIEYPQAKAEFAKICKEAIEKQKPLFSVLMTLVPDNQKMVVKYSYN